jgi:predicted aldo/keto reductase-like oxidoreductase
MGWLSYLTTRGAEYFQHATDKEAVELILNRVIDGGINYFDTARNYERSEENFGLVLSRRRKEVFLATKCEERSYDGALRDVETSLKKLQTNRIDLIQVHHIYDKDDVPALGRKDGVIPALQRLQQEKVVRFIGMTGHPDYRAVKQALTLYDCWDAFMGFINPRASTRPMYDEQLPIALKKQMGIVAMKVFGGSTPAELIGAGPGKAPARQLLRYALSQAITVAIPAVSSLAELEENLEVARDFKPMPAEERESLIARIEEQPSQNAAL